MTDTDVLPDSAAAPLPEITQEAKNVTRIVFPNGRRLFLIGTAHVSKESVKLVDEIIRQTSPDTVCIELDADRYKALTDQNAGEQYKNLDVIKILRTGKAFTFIGRLFLSSYQKKIAEKFETKPGEEFKRAASLAMERGAKIVLADREIGITLKRAWRLFGFFQKVKFIASALFSSNAAEDIDEKQIEDLKKGDTLNNLIEELGRELPIVRQVLIDERDQYLSVKTLAGLEEAESRTAVAVVGAGHVPGMLKYFQSGINSSSSLTEIEQIPNTKQISKLLVWIIPVIVLGMFGWGFYSGRYEEMRQAGFWWVAANGGMTALGCLIALAHPLVICVGFLASPLTSLNPTIGAGIVTGICQAFFSKPTVGDFMEAGEASGSLRGWYKNKLLHIFLVFILSSIGSSIGTFAALPFLKNLLG